LETYAFPLSCLDTAQTTGTRTIPTHARAQTCVPALWTSQLACAC
jgi:hypothetical protein